MIVLLLAAASCAVKYEVIGRTITCSGTGTVEKASVRDAGVYSGYELAVIEEGIEIIGSGAFNQCSKLRHAMLPSTLKRIESHGFGSCGLYNLTIPSSIEFIGDGCFDCTLSMTNCIIEEPCTNYKTVGGVIYERNANGDPYLAVTAPSGLTSVEIPNTVFQLNTNSFRWTRMTSIVLPDCVEKVGSYVFYSSKLKTIHIGKGLMSFEGSALTLCSDLESITVDPENTHFYKEDGVFGLRTSDGVNRASIIFIEEGVTTVHLSETVTSIGSSLRSVGSLTSVTIPSTGHPSWSLGCNNQLVLDKGGQTALSCVGGATSLSFNLPGLITIWGECCMNSPCLETVVIGASIASIGTAAFRDCWKISSFTYETGNTIASVPPQMCYVNKVLTSITFPSTVKTIGDNAFSSCTVLSSVNLGNIVTIGANAFPSCALTSISLVSVTSVGGTAFQRCSQLSSITFGTSTTAVYLTPASFAYCTSLTTVKLPPVLADIKASVFAGCCNLAKVDIDSEVDKKYKCVDNALYSYDLKKFIICPNGFTRMELRQDVQIIGQHSFYECDKLTEVIMYDRVFTVESCAFFMCSKIRMVRLPASVNTIGKSAFDSCALLDYVLYCNDVDIAHVEGDPFPTNPRICLFYTFKGPTFCGHENYEAILDAHCNLPTDYFTNMVSDYAAVKFTPFMCICTFTYYMYWY